MLNADFFTENFAGEWFTQVSTYLLRRKIHKLNLKELYIIVNYTKNNSFIEDKTDQNVLINVCIQELSKQLRIHKADYLNTKIDIKLKQIENNLLKANYTTIKSKYVYEEYIYLIHSNLMFSIGILKNKYNYSYYGITITSYIKLKK
uniref:Chromophore lyase CpcS/CpeS homolog n=1 Tax=Laurencia catarinensis TaxID=197326 RepID=UPI0028D89155|nr:Chromophore lyase CpcS/CpeS homolog [Laurencia catarinensis]WMP12455.1 Chromophore lyase CpcS/CpeS homolog [Laurencia catarinensis]